MLEKSVYTRAMQFGMLLKKKKIMPGVDNT